MRARRRVLTNTTSRRGPVRDLRHRRIRGAILDELCSLDWPRVPSCRKARSVEERPQLGQKLGRAATEVEVADALNLSPPSFPASSTRCTDVAPLPFQIGLDDEDQDVIQLEDIVDDPNHKDALEVIESDEPGKSARDRSTGSRSKQRLVVSLYYYEK